IVAGRQAHPVVWLDQVIVVRDGEEVVAEVAIPRYHLIDGQAPIGEGCVGMKVALEDRHGSISSYPGWAEGSRKQGKSVDLKAINGAIAGPFHVTFHDMSWHLVNSPHKSERWIFEMQGSVKDLRGLDLFPILTLHSRSIRENWDARQNWEAR